MRIAVGVQQGLFGGDQRALAVHMNGAAFAYQRRRKYRQRDLAQYPRREHRIVGERRILVAPGVELPLHPRARAIHPPHESRPDVARPRIVQRQLQQFGLAGAGELGFRRIVRPRHHHHRFE
jgi:hypothetical protein